MPWKPAIRWSLLALDFPGTTTDIENINAMITHVRDHPGDGNRALVDKTAIPELTNQAADVYVSDSGDWYVYTLWREEEIEIILILSAKKK